MLAEEGFDGSVAICDDVHGVEDAKEVFRGDESVFETAETGSTPVGEVKDESVYVTGDTLKKCFCGMAYPLYGTEGEQGDYESGELPVGIAFQVVKVADGIGMYEFAPIEVMHEAIKIIPEGFLAAHGNGGIDRNGYPFLILMMSLKMMNAIATSSMANPIC